MALSRVDLLLAVIASLPVEAIRVKLEIPGPKTKPVGAVRVKAEISHSKPQPLRLCGSIEAAALDAKEAAQMISEFHQAHYSDHMLLFPGASPFWVYVAMRAHDMSPCHHSGMCKSFSLSSDAARLRLKNFAALNSSWAADNFTTGEMQAFFLERGFRDQDGELHPEKLIEWVKAKMCPYFESLGLKQHIKENKFVLVDQTTSGASPIGLAQVFKDCQEEWSASDAVLSEPVKFINILDLGFRVQMFPHSFLPSLLQTVRVVGISTFEDFFHDESPFAQGRRLVPSCKMLTVDAGFCNNLYVDSLDQWITRMKRLGSPMSPCRRVPHSFYGLPFRVMSLPSFDNIAATLNQGSRMAQWADVKKALLDKVATAQESCDSEPWCVLFRSMAAGENWPIPDSILAFADDIAAILT